MIEISNYLDETEIQEIEEREKEKQKNWEEKLEKQKGKPVICICTPEITQKAVALGTIMNWGDYVCVQNDVCTKRDLLDHNQISSGYTVQNTLNYILTFVKIELKDKFCM